MAADLVAAGSTAGCAVGALVCEVRHVQKVREAVDAAGFSKGPGSIVDYAPPKPDGADAAPAADGPPSSKRQRANLKAVHVSPRGAAALEGAMEVPECISELLRDGRARWVGGLRQRARPHVRRSPPPDGAWFTFCELFAGIGGFRCAIEPLGGECVFASEMDVTARELYRINHGGDEPAGDILGVESREVPRHDLLTAGFPCQPFSVCGEQLGMLDRRGQLVFEVVRIAAAHRPKALLLENVAALADVHGGADLRAIKGALAETGYDVRVCTLGAAALVPQRRNRLYIVALRADLRAARAAFAWPDLAARAPRVPPRVRDVLEPEGSVPSSYALSAAQWDALAAKPRSSSKTRDAEAKRWVDLDGAANTLMSSYRRSYHLYSQFVPPTPPHPPRAQPRASGAPAEQVAPRTTPRFFTERECCRLQGFDDSLEVSDCGKNHRFYHVINNAVVPPVVAEIAKALLAALLTESEEGEPGVAADARFGALAAEDAPSVPWPPRWRRLPLP